MSELKNTVLLIEDEPAIRAIYAEVLVQEGYNVLEADNGKDGVKVALENDWDMLLLDIMLPKLDGVNVLKLIKNDPNKREKPVLMLTNVGNENLISECFEYGAEGYLIKAEITPDKILNEVQSYLG